MGSRNRLVIDIRCTKQLSPELRELLGVELCRLYHGDRDDIHWFVDEDLDHPHQHCIESAADNLAVGNAVSDTLHGHVVTSQGSNLYDLRPTRLPVQLMDIWNNIQSVSPSRFGMPKLECIGDLHAIYEVRKEVLVGYTVASSLKHSLTYAKPALEQGGRGKVITILLRSSMSHYRGSVQKWIESQGYFPRIFTISEDGRDASLTE